MTIMEEIQIKLDRIRKALERLSLDAVYLKRQDNFAWMTGGGIKLCRVGRNGQLRPFDHPGQPSTQSPPIRSGPDCVTRKSLRIWVIRSIADLV